MNCGREVGTARDDAGFTVIECSTCHRLNRIRQLLYPDDASYTAEPLDIVDARFLLTLLDEAIAKIGHVAKLGGLA